MKKKLAVSILSIFMLMFAVSCGGNDEESTYNSDWQGALNGSQSIRIEDSGGEIIATYENQADIDAFLDKLDLDNWDVGELNDESEKEYIVKFLKEGSMNSDEGNEDTTETVVGRITTYKGRSVITLESLGLGLELEVPQSALDAIRNAQQ